MKKIIISIALFCLFAIPSLSQISVVSATGYVVNINVYPEAIVTSSTSCTYGYNYTVRMNYQVTFTGNNIPGSLYTLQGTVSNNSSNIFFDLPNNGGVGSQLSSNDYRNIADCNTVTPVSAGFNTVSIQIEGPGISYRNISFPVATVLPIQLKSFDVVTVGNIVKINWVTATETNNDKFSVERSSDGVNWQVIKTIKGAGTSATQISYEIIDNAPVSGIGYYRLRQTDFDSRSTTSEIKMIRSATVAAQQISLFPVPNTGNTVNIKGINNFADYNFSLLTTSGHALYTTVLTKTAVDLPSLAPGIYFIKVGNKVTGDVTSFRYVKM